MKDLFHGGYFRQAYEAGLAAHGPLESWPDQLTAAQLAYHVGSPRLCSLLLLRHARRNPQQLAAQLYMYRWTRRRRGAWFGYWLQESEFSLFEQEHDPLLKIEWLCQKAEFLADFRDFRRAYESLDAAKSIGVESRELTSALSAVLTAQDRAEEALDVVDRALAEDPRNWELVMLRTSLLRRLDREEESFAYLTHTSPLFESMALSATLIGYCIEHEAFQDALLGIERLRAETPLSDKYTERVLQEQRFLCDYRLGNYADVESYLGNHPRPSHRTMLKNLKSSGPEDKRVCLKVKNVRQSHYTCGPATIAIVTNYWDKPASQEEVARQICYDGTSFLEHRRWAESNGWLAREFTVTWDSTRALINLGVPFTLGTAEVDSAHVQVVHGYDEKIGVLCITDPSLGFEVEMLAKEAFERWAFIGPRGIAIWPAEKAHLLADLKLPDSELYDLSYELEQYLDDDNRARAEQAFAKLQGAAPDHLITLQAEVSLAVYDKDFSRAAVSNGAILAKHPGNHTLVYRQQSLLARDGREKSRLDLLTEVTEKSDCPPALTALLASDLLRWPPEFPRAERLLSDALGIAGPNAELHQLMGELRLLQNRSSEGLQLKRFAACLEDKREYLSKDYFSTCLPLGRTEEGLDFLRARYDKLGEQRSSSGQTLCLALEEAGRSAQARELLEELLRRFPNDSELLLFALDRFAAYGELDRLEAITEQHRESSSELDFLRGQAKLHAYKGKPQKELDHWLMIARLEPTAIDAYSEIIACYGKLGQPDKAVLYIQEACRNHPHNLILQKLLFGVVADSMAGDPLGVLKNIVDTFPKDAWAWRNLALQLGPDGEQAIVAAAALDNQSIAFHRCLAGWHLRCGRQEQARVACRNAISTDLLRSTELVSTLVEMSADTAQTLNELSFIWEKLEENRDYPGDVLFVYQTLAEPYFEPQELLVKLVEFNRDRNLSASDVVAEISQMQRAGMLDEALSRAEQAVSDFPYHLGLRILVADLFQASEQKEKEQEALQEALHLSPTSGSVLRRLSELARERGEPQQAIALLQQALAYHPGDSVSRNRLAELYWLQGDKEEAIRSLELTLRLSPDNPWGWETLVEWSGQERAEELAERLTEERPRDPQSWLNLYRVLPATQIERSRAALNSALTLAPLDEETHVARVYFEMGLGRFREALEACRPAEFGDKPPRSLRLEECQVKMRMGRPEEALSDLKRLLESEPHYVPAWNYLVSWTDGDEQLRAAETLVRLQPREPIYYIQLGRAQQANNGDPREAFRTALRFDPLSDSTLVGLLESSREFDDPKQMRSDLTEFGRILSKPEFAYYDWLVYALAVREKAMFEKLRALALEPELEVSLEEACRYLGRTDRDAMVVDTLSPLGEAGKGSWRAGACCARAMRRSKGDASLKRALQSIPEDCDFYAGFVGEYLETLTDWGFEQYLGKNEKLLKSHTYLWSKTLYRMLNRTAEKYKEAVDWSDDWEGRENLKPWALRNRSIALRGVGRWDDAYAVDRWSEENLGIDQATLVGQLDLAIEELAKGECEMAGLRLQRVGPRTAPYHSFLETLLRGALLAQQGRIREARHTINGANKIVAPHHWDPWQRRSQKIVSKFVAGRSKGLLTKLWYGKQLFLLRLKLWLFILWIALAGHYIVRFWNSLPK